MTGTLISGLGGSSVGTRARLVGHVSYGAKTWSLGCRESTCWAKKVVGGPGGAATQEDRLFRRGTERAAVRTHYASLWNP